MTRVQALYELQVVDSAIDERTAALATVEGQLGESEALQAARQAHQQAVEVVRAEEKQVRDLAWQVQDLDEKIRPLDEKLYSGRVRNPKEVSDLHKDVESHKARRRHLEDAELEVMLRLEDARQVERSAAVELAQIEASWRADQERLTIEREALLREVDQFKARREQALRHVIPPDLHQYEQLRTRKGGRAVARVERGLCSACRIAMSSSELQRVRTSPAPLACTSCGRILFAG